MSDPFPILYCGGCGAGRSRRIKRHSGYRENEVFCLIHTEGVPCGDNFGDGVNDDYHYNDDYHDNHDSAEVSN